MKSQLLSKVLSAIMIVMLAIAALPVTPARAATLTVNTLVDENTPVGTNCSLREAIIAANTEAAYNDCAGGTGVDTISFSVTGTITLGSSLPNITDTDALTINGGGNITVSGNNAVRIVSINNNVPITFQDITLINGAVNGSGAAINNSGHLTLTNVTFRNNRGTGGGDDGGALYHTNGRLAITGSTFDGNYTGDNGGAIYVNSGNGTMTISNTIFQNQNNAAIDEGGALYINGGTVNITNSNFSNNAASNNQGGAVLLNGGTTTITGGSFSGNSATDTAGAIRIGADNTTINGVTFQNNIARGNGGGAIWVNDSATNTTIKLSTFIGNSTTRAGNDVRGGAIYNQGINLIVANTTFTNNSATETGAGGNQVAEGGAFYQDDGGPTPSTTLHNVTFSGNTASQTGTGTARGGNLSLQAAGGAGTITLANTIVASGTPNNCAGTITNGGNNIDSAATCGWGSGSGSMSSTNPNLGALTGSPQYFPLNIGSPAINAGNTTVCTGANTANTSQNGLARSPGACDIGSYEISPNTTPTTTGIGAVNVVEDVVDTSIDLWTSFADAEDSDAQLTYTVTNNTNAGLFTSVTAPAPGGQFLVVDYAPDATGTADITVRATDTGGLFVETTFTVTITPVNDSPAFASLPVTSVNQNDPYLYNIVVTDPDVGDTIVITASTLPAWLTFVDNGNGTATLSGTPTSSEVGSHTVVLRATDGVIPVPVEQAFTITVVDVNDAPTFTSAPVTTAGESTPYTYNIVTDDLDALDALTISAPTLPTWLTFTDNGNRTATLSGTPNSSQVGVFNVVLDVTDGLLTASQTFDITVSNTAPQVATASVGATSPFQVTFNQDVFNPADVPPLDPGDVTNPANYLLIRDNGDGFQTTSCAAGVDLQDTAIPVDSVTYSNSGGSGPFVATVIFNGGARLSNGNYRLFVCGTTSIVDIADPTLELAGDGVNPGTDFVRSFAVSISNNGNAGGSGSDDDRNKSAFGSNNPLIPVTGFAPNRITKLPAQPADKAYKPMNELRIEIPTLGINFPIVGVTMAKNGWDLTWLQNSVAYLEGSAYPTLSGNTVLTAHVMDASNNLGPFSDIRGMKLGQQIYIHFDGQVYAYQVQENRKISPSNISAVFKHENYDWITLVTCEDYDAKSGTYKYRRMVRAVLISVVSEK